MRWSFFGLSGAEEDVPVEWPAIAMTANWADRVARLTQLFALWLQLGDTRPLQYAYRERFGAQARVRNATHV